MESIIQEPSGFLLINKPKGITSFDVVYKLRKITKIKKIGHAGTLDPFATGLLILAIGRAATKNISLFLKQDKKYIAEMKLGEISDTYDNTGKIEKKTINEIPNLETIEKTITSFIGEIEQIPPMFSAKKINGQRLYKLARQGVTIERQPSKVIINNIKILEYSFPTLKIEVDCSSGTYIRSLAHDIGEKLNTGAYLENLERISIGKYELKNAVTLEQLEKTDWKNLLFEK